MYIENVSLKSKDKEFVLDVFALASNVYEMSYLEFKNELLVMLMMSEEMSVFKGNNFKD